jgi:hypothetical protein
VNVINSEPLDSCQIGWIVQDGVSLRIIRLMSMRFDASTLNELHRLFNAGSEFLEYLRHVRCHTMLWERRYQATSVGEQWSASPGATSQSVSALVFSEEWCIDAVLNVPLLQRVSEVDSALTIRVLRLSDHRDFVRQFPGRGGCPRIPTMVFFSEGRVEYWCERSRRAAIWFETFVQSDPLPSLEIVDGRPATRELEGWMVRRFEHETSAHDGRLWLDTVREWSRLVERVRGRPTA